MFTGFPQETLEFFLDLRFHNNKLYFEENRARYEEYVKAPFHAFINALAPVVRQIDPLMEVRPYKCLARIHRDTRFSRDKSPFRDHLWLCFRRAAEPKEGSVNFFFEMGVNTLSWGCGTWGENKAMNEILRRRMEASPKGVSGILSSVDFAGHDLTVYTNPYTRMAIPANIPEHLKPWYAMRECYVGKAKTDMAWVFTPELVDRVAADFRAMAPLYHLLRGAYDQAEQP